MVLYYRVSGGLNDAKRQFSKARDCGGDADNVDDEDERKDKTHVASEEDPCSQQKCRIDHNFNYSRLVASCSPPSPRGQIEARIRGNP